MNKENKQAYLLFILAMFGYLIQLALNLFLANHLTPDKYGDFNIALKFLEIFVECSLFGTSYGATIFLAKYIQQLKRTAELDYITWNITLVSRSFFATFVLAATACILMFVLHYLGIKHIHQYYLAVYMLWVAPFAAVAALMGCFFLSNNQVFFAAILPDILCYFLELIFFITLVLFFNATLTNLTIVITLLLAYLTLSIVSVFFTQNSMLRLLILGLKKRSYQQMTSTPWFQASLKLIVNNIIFLIISVFDLLTIKIFAKNVLSVGHYGAVLTIVSVIWMIPNNLYKGIRPQYANLLKSKKGRDNLQSILIQTSMVVDFLTIILGISIIYFSTTLLAHFGQSYLVAKPALIFLTTAICIGSIIRSDAQSLLIYAELEHLVLKMNMMELFSMFLIVIPATYFWGIIGTAVSNGIIIMTYKPCVTVFLVHKKIGLRPLLVL